MVSGFSNFRIASVIFAFALMAFAILVWIDFDSTDGHKTAIRDWDNQRPVLYVDRAKTQYTKNKLFFDRQYSQKFGIKFVICKNMQNKTVLSYNSTIKELLTTQELPAWAKKLRFSDERTEASFSKLIGEQIMKFPFQVNEHITIFQTDDTHFRISSPNLSFSFGSIDEKVKFAKLDPDFFLVRFEQNVAILNEEGNLILQCSKQGQNNGD